MTFPAHRCRPHLERPLYAASAKMVRGSLTGKDDEINVALSGGGGHKAGVRHLALEPADGTFQSIVPFKRPFSIAC